MLRIDNLGGLRLPRLLPGQAPHRPGDRRLRARGRDHRHLPLLRAGPRLRPRAVRLLRARPAQDRRPGPGRPRAEALLAGDEYADAVRADAKLTREAGVTAVPFTVLGGRLAIPGTATASAYADAINQALTTGDPQ